MKNLSGQQVVKLSNNLRGNVVFPEDQEYEGACRIWNAMINKRPAAIVRCADANDVLHTIAFAHEYELELSIRGAGHNIAGNSLCDDGLTIDFSLMRNVRVDSSKKRAYVEPGATLGDFDKAVQAHGLATPIGINSTTGVAGLTLGGGFGWLTRKYGLTIDNLVSADVITAAGEKITASENDHADLFWAIRGGGGNFGVITQFEFKLHSVGPEILGGLIVFPFSQAKQVLRQYREFINSAPLELNVWMILRQAPPLPFLPTEIHGKEVVVLPVFYAGDIDEGEKLLQPLRNLGTPLGEHIGSQPYLQWQQAFDPLLTSGARNYWKSHNFTELADGVLDCMIEYAGKLPTLQCEIFLGLLDGVSNDIPADATAYGPRNAKFAMNVHARWEEEKEDDKCISWAREFFKASAPYASKGAYVNFMTEDEGARIESAYASNYSRLRQMKKKYDPDNFFHFNQNIIPA